MKEAILQTLNLSPEVYWRWFREVTFSQDYHPRLLAQKIWLVRCQWLRPAVKLVEAVLVESYVSILPFKLKSWVTCHQPVTWEAVVPMEAYASAEVGAYLIPKALEKQAENNPLWRLGPSNHSTVSTH